MDEDEGGEMFELEEVDDNDTLLVQVQNSLSVHVTSSMYTGIDWRDEFDRISDDGDKIFLQMTEHVQEWKS